MPVIRNRRSRVTGCMSAPRIAIVGAGISGLVVAHALHPAHDLTLFEAGGHAGGHTNTVRVVTDTAEHDIDTGFIVFNDRNYPHFKRLLAELGVAGAAVRHELLGRRRAGRLRVQRLLAAASTPRARNLVTPVLPAHGRRRTCASTASARALLERRRRRPVAARLARTSERFSRAFVERLIVPQASAVWSADPEQMWTFPARFLVEFFANHGMLGLRDRPQLAHGQRRLGALRRGAHAPVPRPPAPAHAGRARSSASTTTSSVTPARRRARALRPGRARRRTPTRRCAMLADATRARARDARRDPLPAPTRPCCTPTGRCCRAAARAWASWNYHLLDEPSRSLDGHLPHEPPPARCAPTASSA